MQNTVLAYPKIARKLLQLKWPKGREAISFDVLADIMGYAPDVVDALISHGLLVRRPDQLYELAFVEEAGRQAACTRPVN